MREHGLAGEIAVATSFYHEKGGYGGARELLNRTPRPTAIFAGADQAAFGALAAVHEAGLRVPADVSVTGYDNTHLAALPNIALTSVDQGGSVHGDRRRQAAAGAHRRPHVGGALLGDAQPDRPGFHRRACGVNRFSTRVAPPVVSRRIIR